MGKIGFEPIWPDLQSGALTNFAISPYLCFFLYMCWFVNDSWGIGHGVTFAAWHCGSDVETADWFGVDGVDRKSTRLNSSHSAKSRMPSSA